MKLVWRTRSHLHWWVPFLTRGAVGKTGSHLYLPGVFARWSPDRGRIAADFGLLLFGVLGLVYTRNPTGTLMATRPHGWTLRWATLKLGNPVKPPSIY